MRWAFKLVDRVKQIPPPPKWVSTIQSEEA